MRNKVVIVDDAGATIDSANPLEVTATLAASEASDPDLAYIEAVILAQEGDVVSTFTKGKALNKFGRTDNADADVRTTVGAFGSVTPTVNEVFQTTNVIDYVVSSSASDTGVVNVEGHTIDGSGLLTFVEQEVTLNGTTPVLLGTLLARASRMTVKDGTFGSPAADLVGDVFVYVSGNTVTAGVPQTSADVILRVHAGVNQSEKCATSLSQYDYWIITGLTVALDHTGGQTTAVDFFLEYRDLGGVWHPLGAAIDIARDAPFQYLPFRPYRYVKPNSDIRVVAVSDSADTTVSAEIEGYLALIVV